MIRFLSFIFCRTGGFRDCSFLYFGVKLFVNAVLYGLESVLRLSGMCLVGRNFGFVWVLDFSSESEELPSGGKSFSVNEGEREGRPGNNVGGGGCLEASRVLGLEDRIGLELALFVWGRNSSLSVDELEILRGIGTRGFGRGGAGFAEIPGFFLAAVEICLVLGTALHFEKC